jgi:hypothetical protein
VGVVLCQCGISEMQRGSHNHHRRTSTLHKQVRSGDGGTVASPINTIPALARFLRAKPVRQSVCNTVCNSERLPSAIHTRRWGGLRGLRNARTFTTALVIPKSSRPAQSLTPILIGLFDLLRTSFVPKVPKSLLLTCVSFFPGSTPCSPHTRGGGVRELGISG